MTVFAPNFSISTKTANALVRIEAVRQRIDFLPIHPSILLSLRESAKLHSTHYSTVIEGNRLTHEQVEQVVAKSQHFPGRERDEAEVKGYYAAIHELEATVAHCQFATIHPSNDGNGRTARLLTNLILHLGGYDLKGLYSLEDSAIQRNRVIRHSSIVQLQAKIGNRIIERMGKR